MFAISHYCEKARWALDHHGIEYEISHLPPGPHAFTAKKLGATATTLPILVAGDQVV
ncbi:MAG: glutathione S-transferase N-terminal domain-containing protein, partial [Thermodesulfobacteriota bacterium]